MAGWNPCLVDVQCLGHSGHYLQPEEKGLVSPDAHGDHASGRRKEQDLSKILIREAWKISGKKPEVFLKEKQ